MVRKGERYTVTAEGYTSDGLAVVRVDGQAVFVPGAIRGETVEICIDTVNSNAAYGRIVTILEPSAHRTPRLCPYAKRCGGCDFWHMDYEEELGLKSQRIRDAMTRLGGFDPGPVPILGAQNPEGYRNKAQYPVAMGKKTACGRILPGQNPSGDCR